MSLHIPAKESWSAADKIACSLPDYLIDMTNGFAKGLLTFIDDQKVALFPQVNITNASEQKASDGVLTNISLQVMAHT